MNAHSPTIPWSVSIVVPARNEEQLIGRCIASVLQTLATSTRQLHASRLVIVADRCHDDTVGAAHRAATITPNLFHEHRNVMVTTTACGVGHARGIGTKYAMATLPGISPSRVWIANTDADSEVPETWIEDQLRWADAGYHGVAGTVEVDSFADFPRGIESRFHRRYTALLPTGDDDHGHVHAANMGVRLDAYLAAGGWAPLLRSEDRDLWTRLSATGHRTRSPAALRVLTSGRKQNRIVDGFAASLVALQTAEPQPAGAS